MKRTDHDGRAFAGSQRQIQSYVNRRAEDLSSAVLAVLGPLPLGAQLVWVSPLERHGFAEYRDAAFLERTGCADCWPKLAEFWPRGGPSWDALAKLTWPGGSGVVLVEAKSHVREIGGVGCNATPLAREHITRSLAATKRWLGISDDSDWLGPLYQSANRLAHLYFLREISGVPAWLVNIYFLDDPHSPTDIDAWRAGLEGVKGELGCGKRVLPLSD